MKRQSHTFGYCLTDHHGSCPERISHWETGKVYNCGCECHLSHGNDQLILVLAAEVWQ